MTAALAVLPPDRRPSFRCQFFDTSKAGSQVHPPPLAVGRIGLQAVAYVADLDLLGASPMAGRCSEERLPLPGVHQPEACRAGVVIAVLA